MNVACSTLIQNITEHSSLLCCRIGKDLVGVGQLSWLFAPSLFWRYLFISWLLNMRMIIYDIFLNNSTHRRHWEVAIDDHQIATDNLAVQASARRNLETTTPRPGVIGSKLSTAAWWQRSEAVKAVLKQSVKSVETMLHLGEIRDELGSPLLAFIPADHHDSCDTVIIWSFKWSFLFVDKHRQVCGSAQLANSTGHIVPLKCNAEWFGSINNCPVLLAGRVHSVLLRCNLPIFENTRFQPFPARLDAKRTTTALICRRLGLVRPEHRPARSWSTLARSST